MCAKPTLCVSLAADGLAVETNGVQLGTVAESRERFQRTAHTVGDCLQAVKGLSQQANSARSFREKCSNLLGAAIAASLALQEVCGDTLQSASPVT